MASLGRLLVAAAVSATMQVGSVATTGAHEIGTTRVAVLLHHWQGSRTYAIEISTDASALAEKLAAINGQSVPDGISAGDLLSTITRSDEQFRRRVKISFDGSETRPTIAYSVAPRSNEASSGMVAAIRLTGAIPPGASQFTWTYGWTFTTYAMTLQRSPRESPRTQLLEGGQSSVPFDMTKPADTSGWASTARRYLVFGFTCIVPNGLDCTLFVFGIALSRRVREVLGQVGIMGVAYAVALGMSLYGQVSLSPAIVGTLIALLIGYLALENVFLSTSYSRRLMLGSVFALVHGIGVSARLLNLDIPQMEFPTALLWCAVGIEAALLTVVAAAFLLVRWQYVDRPWYRADIVTPSSLVMASAAAYWAVSNLGS